MSVRLAHHPMCSLKCTNPFDFTKLTLRANAIKSLLKLDKKVDLFTRHGVNYRILMYLSLDNPNLKIHSLEPQNTKTIKPIIQPKEDSKPQKTMNRRVIITKPLPVIQGCFVCKRKYEFNKRFKFPTVCPYCRKLISERYPFLTHEGNIIYSFKKEYNESMERFGYYDINQRKEEPHLVLEDIDGDNFNTIDFTASTKRRGRGRYFKIYFILSIVKKFEFRYL